MRMKNLMLILAGFVSFWSLDEAYTAVLCVNPNTPNCFSTIQAAVNAASTGDMINIAPNPSPKGYTENVVVNTSGLTIKGSAQVIVDTCETTAFPNGCGGSGFEINASGVTIENLIIRHARDGVRIMVGGDNTIIRKVNFIEILDTGVEADNGSSNNVNNVEVAGIGSCFDLVPIRVAVAIAIPGVVSVNDAHDDLPVIVGAPAAQPSLELNRDAAVKDSGTMQGPVGERTKKEWR